MGIKPSQTLPPVTDESNPPSPTSAKTQAPATIAEPHIENLAPPLRAENDDDHHQNNSIKKITTNSKSKRKVPKKVEMMGKASVVVQAIYGQTEEDTGKTLSDILSNAEVSRETFNKSAHFKDARMAWDSLKSKRDDNQHYLKDNSDSKSDY